MNSRTTLSVAFLATLGLTVAGCNSKTSQPAAEPGEAGHAAHDHPTTGPHGGDLIELGDEQYHAEITHEKDATVYLLDGSAKAAAPIDAAEIVINVTHDGKAEQFHLAASRDAQDPEGKSSRFAASDAELVADLQEGHADVQLVVTINGTQYRGNLEHDHEH